MPAPRIRTILVGVDPSSPQAPDPVLEAALRLTTALGADLHVAHAVESGPLDPPLPPTLSQEMETARRALDSWLDDALPTPGAAASRHVELGRAHRVLAARAAEIGADLVVVGPNRAGPVEAGMLGTTVDRLLRTIRVPCWVVRGELRLPIRRLGAPTDFSDLSNRALDVALELAAALGGAEGVPGAAPPDLDVLHVEWPAALDDDPERADRILLPNLEDAVAAAKRRVDHPRAAATRARVLAAVDPSRGILGYAERHHPDLLVLATHGRGAVARTLLGAVASVVAREAPCHTVLVPPPPDTLDDRR